MAGVLDGVRVFDLTLAAVGPWSAKLLGELGADVIHVEGPKPELAHHIPPDIAGTGVLYLTANTNKRSIVLDLKSDADRQRALALLRTCDVFVQNMRPGAVEKLGLGYDEVVLQRPDIIYVSASAYGRVGPMATEAGVDPLLQSFCGWSSITGPAGSDGEMFRHYAHLDLTTSSMIVEAVLAALLVRGRTGQGQHVELQMLAAALSLQSNRLAEHFATGVAARPLGSASATTAPHEAFRCADGRWLAVGVERDDQWARLWRAIGADDLGADRGLDRNAGRLARREELSTAIAARLATKPAAWWAICLTRARVPHSRLFDFDELRHHPQVIANGHLVELDTDRYGAIAMEGPPWRFAGTPERPPRPGGPAGQHTDEVFSSLLEPVPVRAAEPGAADRAGPAGSAGAATAAPLAGTLVVELAEGVAGPFACARLADLGAAVVKIERIDGDPARDHGPALPGASGAAPALTATFAALNRGKRSIAVDLAQPDGRALVRRLLERADVVVEGLPPGEAAGHGLAYDDAAAANPGLVYVAVSGWGEHGPLAGQPAAELAVQAMAEYLSSLGRIGEPPVRLGTDVAGMNTGIFACQAALAGLLVRQGVGPTDGRPGGGQRVAVSMLGSLLHLRGIMWTARSNPDDWYGFHLDHYTNPPESGYRTADGQVFFGLRRGNSEDFDQLMIALGLVEHITDPRFVDFGRQAAPLGRYAVEAKEVWESAFETMTTQEVIDLFHERGGDAVPFTDHPTITAHPQVEAIGALTTVEQEGFGPLRAVAPPWTFTATPAVIGAGAPALGRHTDEILSELGLTAGELADLRARGVIR
jgi:crotonobetainyl-CoA:carnitine CoA-transferase CaiB-like acyl-CoA transferase